MAVIDPAKAGAQILPFYLAGDAGDSAVIRGRFASGACPLTSILERHGSPDQVAALQAEAPALAAFRSTFMNFDWFFTH